jgi:hypothetical protein
MSNRAGLRSPASAASRRRVASIVLLDCACCSGDNEFHTKSSATCMFFTVSGLKCLPSAAINVPKEPSVSDLARRAAPRLSDGRLTGRAFKPSGKPTIADERRPLYPPKADICSATRHVRFGPIADIHVTHSITSSAWARSAGGTVRPSAMAALRLITSSYEPAVLLSLL